MSQAQELTAPGPRPWPRYGFAISAGTSNSNRHVAAAVALALAALIAGLAAAGSNAAAGPALRPNVIVVMTDDQAPGLIKALPSVQRLIGGRGASFENAIVSYPLCCPSRASFLTGQYAHNHGTLGNGPRSGGGYRALIDRRRNLAAWFQASGYETAFVGKWLNGLRTPRVAPPGWTQWHGLVGAGGEGLSSFYDFDIFEPDGSPRHYGSAPRDYQTDVLTREYALPLISEQAVTPGSFFLWLAYHPPHDGLGRNDSAGRRCSIGDPTVRGGRQSAIPAPRHAKRFAHARVPRPPSFNEKDVSDKPAFIQRGDPLGPRDLEVVTLNYRCGLAALLSVDESVEALVDALERTGQLDNTILVFTADNGMLGGEHRIKAAKNRPYEEALRVPLMIRGPGVAADLVSDDLVANIDLAPTLLDLAGVQIPPELDRIVDGTSLASQLAGASPAPGRAVLIEGRDNVRKSRHAYKARSYVGVRTGRYAYFEHRRGSASSPGEAIDLPIGAGRTTDVELYDLNRDTFQLQSRHRDRSYAKPRRVLETLLAELESCAGTACNALSSEPGPSRRRRG